MSLAATGTTSYTLEQVGKVNTIKLLRLCQAVQKRTQNHPGRAIIRKPGEKFGLACPAAE
jgi:hypothetical protein